MHLNEYANTELHKAWEDLPQNIRGKIVIGKHKLHCEDPIRVYRYGVPGSQIGGKKVDGLHLRGSSGKIAFTRSMANIMVQANITSSIRVEEVIKNRVIKMKKKNLQGSARRQGATPRPEPETGLGRRHGASQGMDAQDPNNIRAGELQYSIEVTNQWSALRQENC